MAKHGVFDESVARQALMLLGKELGSGPGIAIVVIGGAAAHLIGLLPAAMTTADVDAIHFRPPGAVDEVLAAADRVADHLGLPKGWLNHDDAGLYAHALPPGWETRRRDIGTFGRLRVETLGRRDLIAMKFFAHRQVDIEHLTQMNVLEEELEFVRGYLKKLRAESPADRGAVDLALHVVNEWGRK